MESFNLPKSLKLRTDKYTIFDCIRKRYVA